MDSTPAIKTPSLGGGKRAVGLQCGTQDAGHPQGEWSASGGGIRQHPIPLLATKSPPPTGHHLRASVWILGGRRELDNPVFLGDTRSSVFASIGFAVTGRVTACKPVPIPPNELPISLASRGKPRNQPMGS